jgi:hypothetical protein
MFFSSQVIGQAEMLVRYAGVNPKDIKGMRAPFLAVGGDTMFRMLNRYNFLFGYISLTNGQTGIPDKK